MVPPTIHYPSKRLPTRRDMLQRKANFVVVNPPLKDACDPLLLPDCRSLSLGAIVVYVFSWSVNDLFFLFC